MTISLQCEKRTDRVLGDGGMLVLSAMISSISFCNYEFHGRVGIIADHCSDRSRPKKSFDFAAKVTRFFMNFNKQLVDVEVIYNPFSPTCKLRGPTQSLQLLSFDVLNS